MAKEKIVSGPNAFRLLSLNNKSNGPTYPVSVDYTFLTDLFNLERSYASDSVVMFRRQSHPLRKFHVTGMSIRLMMTIFRRFNTEGALVGVPIHRLYCLMNEEYEEGGSKEQFYAEIRKFIELGLLSVSRDGIVNEWKLESFKRKTSRFILFNPLVFSKGFTDLEVAAQKLYMYIVSRNGDKVKAEFKEFIESNSWIYTLTHKSRPSQVRQLLESLKSLEPVEGQPLLLEGSVEKDLLGRWSVRCVLNPVYLVKHIEGAHYRMVPQAKIPYSKTVARLRLLLEHFRIGEVQFLDNGRFFLKLAQLLHNASFKTIRFVVARIKEMLQRNGYDQHMLQAIQSELQNQTFVRFVEIMKDTGVYAYLGMGDGAFDNARPLQFFRSANQHFTIKTFKRTCIRAFPLLRQRFGEALRSEIINMIQPSRPGMTVEYETFFLEDFLIDLAQSKTTRTA
ncbi:hypothetical protein [Cohnella sp. AR92]|uniref:hypothetical protein n=1 Tax=Cohnella sp. AR92 TaxID=648716 RepID=UPI000F8D487E|nr:hypothetical protein [Cohnella sp. AR92]RUS44991.1 hypothetical protein ELR57_22310 [Cohnella sp. AR92]